MNPHAYSVLALLACLIGIAATSATAAAERFDVIFRGGEVMDGSGDPAFRADVGIREDRIAAIGDLGADHGEQVVDSTGLLIVPGFIDLHSHADGGGETGGLRSRNNKRRAAPNLVSQGITTVVVNQDGRSLSDLSRQRRQLSARGFGPNAVLMVGHNTIRRIALEGGSKERPATPGEIAAMREMLREGMDAGAYGLSAGLEYAPGIWSTTDELIALVRDVVPYGGVYIVHERASGNDPMWYIPSQHDPVQPTMLDSILETIRIAEATGATVVATHIKARGVNYWGSSEAIIEAIESARARGLRIYADQYPYTTSGSDGTIALIPYWIMDEFPGPRDDYVGALTRILQDPEKRAKMEGDIRHMIARRGGADHVMVLLHPDERYIGRMLDALATQREVDVIQMVYLLQIEGFRDRFGGALLRGFSMSEEDVERFAARPWVATASDAGVTLPEDGPMHARYYGTFPRKIRHYALERGIISVGQAIRSMTSLPAEIMNFKDRGWIRVGYKADIAVIDLDAIRDRSTFLRPHRYSEGVPYVMINGEFVVDENILTFALPGKILTPATSRRPIETDD